MRRIYETCRPRPEVLAGTLGEEEFAARLGVVTAAPADVPAAVRVYTDPTIFWLRTYPTSGLTTLLREVLGRLSGADPTAAPIIRLETGFGGGKTHNLLAAYHAAAGHLPPASLGPLVDPGWVPHERVRLAAVVGEDLDPIAGLAHPDGVVTRTPWGEIAYQLGGAAGYHAVERHDREGVPPTAQVWQQLFGTGPALVLLDELAPYLRALRASRTHAAAAGQLAPFLKALLQAVAAAPRAVCVITLAESSDAFGQETEEIAQALGQLVAELKSISARVERVLTPTTGEDEIGQILVHRLFEAVDRGAARDAAQAYRDYFERLQRQEANLPATAFQAEYARLIEQSYPYHPEVLVVLNRKISTIPNFQRTRGALRLLSVGLRRVWEVRPPDAFLFHLHHFDLAYDPVVHEVTSRLDRARYRQVVEADIASGVSDAPAHAEEIDRSWMEQGRPACARKVATAIFLHSLTQGGGQGARAEEVNLAALAPGDDPVLVEQALRELERRCWHLEPEGERWRFQPEPSLERMILDEVQFVGVASAKRDLDERLKGIWQSGVFDVRRFPAEPHEIPDDLGRPKLALMHYDAASVREEDTAPPELVRRLFEESGTAGGVRTYQNNVVFLAADAAQVGRMVEACRHWKAVCRLSDDPDRARGLTADQRKRLRARRDESDLGLRLAIHRTYRYLFYPSGEAPKTAAGLAREALPAQEQGDIQRDQSQVILEALRRLDKVYTADSQPIAPEFLKSRAWPAGRRSVAVSDVVRAFAMRRGLRMLLDTRPLRDGIIEGVRRGQWIYYDPREGVGYGTVSSTPLVNLDGEAELLEPQEAQARSITIKGVAPAEERCPVCGNPASACTCGKEIPPPPPAEAELRSEGAVEQALQAVLDQMHDRRTERLASIRVQVQGQGQEGLRELRSVGLAVPQLGPGEYRLELVITAEFGATGGSLRMEFHGPWDRYRRVKDGLEAVLGQASDLSTRAVLHCRFGDPGADATRLATIRDVLRALDIGRVDVIADPAKGA
jgi:hypothetical protein